jgi:hypothetical protein
MEEGVDRKEDGRHMRESGESSRAEGGLDRM